MMERLKDLRQYAGEKPVCPPCATAMTLQRSERFTYPNGAARMFWECVTCGNRIPAAPDGTPVGTPPPDPETKHARVACATALNALQALKEWDAATITAWAAEQLKTVPEAVLIATFTEEQCETLLKFIDAAEAAHYEAKDERHHW